MTDLLAARMQMATSLAFHIIFAVVGMAMPLLMVLAEWRWLKTGNPVYLTLAKRWMRGTAIMFAVGAVSGTVLSFELGLLWPEFMRFAGPAISLPFTMEGFAFFLEAIFLGIYLYGWDRVSRGMHLFSGIIVAVSGTLSGVFVVTANAWMNTPTGFTLVDGVMTEIDPWAAMLNPAAPTQVVHMVLAAFQCVGFAVAAIHAWGLLKKPDSAFHRAALGIALPVAVVTSLLQPVSGDLCAKMVAKLQPAKLAALEAHWETETGAPLRIGGWPDEEAEETNFAIEIPYLLSILSFGDPGAEVTGLKDIPRDLRPPVAPVHLSFQIMVGFGTIMALTGLLAIVLWLRGKRQLPQHPGFLKLLIINGPLGVLAMEAGWMVTEIGRQPWIIQGIMRTSEGVTRLPYVWTTFVLFMGIYIVLARVVYVLLKRQVFASFEREEDGP